MSKTTPLVPNAFTPGPWTVTNDGRYIYGAGDDGYICDIKLDEDDPEVIANANLIAAAPMLYEGAVDTVQALILLRLGLRGDAKVIAVIDAHIDELEYAIRAARGEQQ